MVQTKTEVVKILSHPETAEDTVPDGEHASVIGVVFASEYRVMQAVHHRGGDDEPGQTIHGRRNGDVAVLEFDDRSHEERVKQQVFDASAHQHEEGETKQFREQDLHIMEPPAGGDIEGCVAVVYRVESPEKRQFMVETMPDIHPQVDEKDYQDGFGNGGKSQHPYSMPGISRPVQHECHEYARREQYQQIETGHRKVELCMEATALLQGETGVEALDDPEQHSAGNGGGV